jgi:2',3'-cyclic-nucleotide 2'-phosphodiesterase / 3'-nucleotidase / 5'-nucleotidase
MNRILTLLALSIGLAVPASAAADPVTLSLLGRTAALGEGGAEIAAFDPRSDRAFATNAAADRLDVYDFSNPAAPSLVKSVDLPGGPNSVAVRRDGLVAVAVEAPDKTDPGTVQFLDVDGEPLGSVGVGALPDMLTFTPGGVLLVANEGEASDDGSVDPPGSVSVIHVNSDASRIWLRTAGFRGVRTSGPVRVVCPGATQAQDFEPEYIAFGDHGEALVTIQEANAVGVLDVRRARFEVVRSLGFKDHGKTANALDPSDRDNAIAIAPWKGLFGMYQPDAIASYEVKGKSLFVTANEGDVRERAGCAEESRVKDLTLDPVAFPNGEKADPKLGRLTVTKTLGDKGGDGDYDQLYVFGGRSLSILDDDGELVFDTGSELERKAAALEPFAFNADNVQPVQVDNRSDNKGPEPEGVAVGSIGGDVYAFLGSERQGGIYAYDLTAKKGEARFAGYLNPRPGDLGPEGLQFVPAHQSPTDAPLLFVTNEITGTIAAFAVEEE